MYTENVQKLILIPKIFCKLFLIDKIIHEKKTSVWLNLLLFIFFGYVLFIINFNFNHLSQYPEDFSAIILG